MLYPQLLRWLLCLQTCGLTFIMPIYSQISKGHINGERYNNSIIKSVSNNNVKPVSTIPSKPPIDSAAIANWADLLWSEPSITPDGKYFMYPIDNLPAGGKTLVIQSTQNEWKKEFVGAEKGFFSGDSKKAVFKTADSLFILSLGKDKVMSIEGVTSYKSPKEGAGQWLAYVTKTNELTLQNLFTDKKLQYQNVWEYQFNNAGRALLMKKKIKKDSAISESVEWITLPTNKQYTVWQTTNDKEYSASHFSFDEAGQQLVFIVQNKSNNTPANTIWYYKEGAEAIEKVNDQTPGMDSGMTVSPSAPTLSKNGKYIFFKIQPILVVLSKPGPNAVQVDVWSYKDVLMQNIQLYNVRKGKHSVDVTTELTTVLCIGAHNVCCVERSEVQNIFFAGPDDNAIVAQKQFVGDKLWIDEPTSYYLVCLKNGTQKLLGKGSYDHFAFSPDGAYVIYYDQVKTNFFTYHLSTSETKNISASIQEPLILDSDKRSKYKSTAIIGIKGWLTPTTVLIYTKYDIWQIDITDKIVPINLTNGYGKAHHIKFRLLNENNVDKGMAYAFNKPLLLAAFDTETKNNGFFQAYFGRVQDPEELSMQPYLLYTTSYQSHIGLLNMKPVKPTEADVWIVKRQSASEAANFFLTKDFKTFKQLTNLQPQKQYNWLTTELLTWKQFDGEECQGIFYKPENFDSSKKYPVIINYYEKLSDGLNQFRHPEFMSANLNIPWFVSRGYLVFTPDIHYTIGETGESVVNSVVSGAKYLFKLPFVDSTKVGIQGHSFGGYETNYLVTHTNTFAAASEGAGPTDFISCYGSLLQDGSPNNGYQILHFESGGGQNRLEAVLWENHEVYINNSPIFHADKVTTPLLMMHNKKDDIVPWSQAVEFFIALRRLDKKVWMLQYDNGEHGIFGKDAVDYTIRMTQFFDYYLKETGAPKWMTKGISANLKGIDSGYELDSPTQIP